MKNIDLEQEAENLKNVYVAEAESGGLGMFAARNLIKGQEVFTLIGGTIDYHTDYTFPLNEHDKYEPRINKSISQYLNHSCCPNVHPSSNGRSYMAMRDINKDEEITTSYSFLGRKFGYEKTIDGSRPIILHVSVCKKIVKEEF